MSRGRRRKWPFPTRAPMAPSTGDQYSENGKDLPDQDAWGKESRTTPDTEAEAKPERGVNDFWAG